MKKIFLRPMRRVSAVLTAAVVLGGLVANAQNPAVFPTNVYYMKQNVPANTPPPYNAGGGVPAGALIATPVVTSTNCTISWYGMRGDSTVQGSTDLVNWVNLTNVAATNYAWTVTITNSLGGGGNFRLSQNNTFTGPSACAGCHADKYNVWTNSLHGHAIKEILNPDGSFQAFRNASCLPCHTVGNGQPNGYVYTSNSAAYSSMLANVGCENCHGPAGWHKASDKDSITPAVSQDPAICGSCHQGNKHPTYTEWLAWTNLPYTVYSFSIATNTSRTTNAGPPITYTTNYTYSTNLTTSMDPNAPMGLNVSGVGHNTGDHQSLGCSTCHAANNRAVMVKEYYDRLAGHPHPVTLFSSAPVTNYVTLTLNGITALAQLSPNGVKYQSDGNAFGAATCATCHDPHGSTNAAQMRYPLASTNWYCVPTVTDPTLVLVTNVNGTVTTNSTSSVAYNTAFDSFFNPNVQVCGQCHSSRGSRWDGSTYGWITNSVVTNIVTLAHYVPVTTYVTNTSVTTNFSITYVWTGTNSVPTTNTTVNTNVYVIPWGSTQVLVAGSTNSLTNSTFALGVYYPLIAYTNGGTTYYTTNSSGDSAPHYSEQYNVLVGQLDYDFAANGGPTNVLTDPHTLAPNQCAACHVPSYAVNASVNVTGHSFVNDYNGCLAQCHSSSITVAGLALKTLNSKIAVSNGMDRVVSLLRQWGTNVAPAILATNYGPLAWEYPSINSYFSTPSTNVVGGVTKKFFTGPQSSFKLAANALSPNFTNDNLQLAYVPADIRKIRFALNVFYRDQSYGVHNPTYVKSVLAWAENNLMGRFVAAGWPATFSADVVSGSAPLTVNFTNTGSGSVYGWTFGDGGTAAAANPSYTYTTPGLYSVTCTVDGKSLTRTKLILVQ